MLESVKLTPTLWPDSLPHPKEEKIISVFCGSTNIKWALHEGVGMNFSPSCCWRTELITDEDVSSAPPSSVLGRLLPTAAMRMVFGQDDGTATKQMALEQSHGRFASLLTIYMISSNSDQARKVVWCFSEIPSRVYALQPDDFFSVEQGRCESIGIDRLACLRAAGDMVGFPALVIDAGTCMTYTACDDKGHIVGGGITLGLAAKFAAVAQSIKDTPGIVTDQQHEEMIRLANDIVDQNKPLDFFCRGLNEAVVSSTLREVAFHCRKIIKTYLDNIYAKASLADKNDTNLSTHTGMNNVVPKIIFTGPDSMILSNLLTREENHLIAPDNDIRPFTVNEYKHLLAFGIASALQAKVGEYKLVPCEEFDKVLIGCRVAKQFTVLDEDGDCIYRGTIASSVRSKQKDLHNYLVLYDDVDTEELNLVQIHAALLLYNQVGEKKLKTHNHEIAMKISEKKRIALAAAKELELKDSRVKDKAEANRVASAVVVSISKPMPSSSIARQSINDSGRENLAATKRKSNDLISTTKSKKPKPPNPLSDPSYFFNQRVAKYFDDVLFFGVVARFDKVEKLWQIDYDDGDEEEFNKNELMFHINLYETNKHLDKKGK